MILNDTQIQFNSAGSTGGGVFCQNSTAWFDLFHIRQNNAGAFNVDYYCNKLCLTLKRDCACGTQLCGANIPVGPPITPHKKPDDNKGGKIAAGILVPVIVIGLVAAGFYLYKRHSTAIRSRLLYSSL